MFGTNKKGLGSVRIYRVYQQVVVWFLHSFNKMRNDRYYTEDYGRKPRKCAMTVMHSGGHNRIAQVDSTLWDFFQNQFLIKSEKWTHVLALYTFETRGK